MSEEPVYRQALRDATAKRRLEAALAHQEVLERMAPGRLQTTKYLAANSRALAVAARDYLAAEANRD